MIRNVLIGFYLLLFAACFDNSISGSSTVNGTYTLGTVNGSALPFTTSGSGSNKTEVTDDAFTLYSGGTYARSGHVRNTVSGQVTTVTTSDTGPYSLLGNSVSLRSNNTGLTIAGPIDGNTMTLTMSGAVWIYSK